MTNNRSFSWVAMLALGVIITSCAMEPEGESEGDPTITFELPDSTISFEEADAEAGILRGSYEHAGHFITFEAVRGERNPVDEHSPVFAIDARLCDQRGYCFALLAGGHGIADESWLALQSEVFPDLLQARASHETTMAFHAELVRLDRLMLPGLEEELRALEALSNFPSPDDDFVATPPPLGYEQDDEPGIVALSYNYTHWFEIWTGPLGFPLSQYLGEHSSTRSISRDGSGYIWHYVATSNHGAHPGDSGMSLKCSRSFTNRPMYLPVTTSCSAAAVQDTYHSYGDTASCCSTAYGFYYGNHVCNDDTHLQRDMMIYNASIVPGYCSDATIQRYAPSCW